VTLELGGNEQLARDLAAGGVFVPGCTLAINEDCELVVRGAGEELAIAARVVWVDGTRGVGLQLIGCDAAVKARIGQMASGADAPAAETAAETESEHEHEHEAEADEEAEAEDEAARERAPNVHERLRGLSLAQQIKIASAGDVGDRTVLERMYGKNVWEALLRNPRLTAPEVTRIARMATLPRPLVEIIVNNGTWLQIPEIRRALLKNTRISPDQIQRVLRLLPKTDLKVIVGAAVYPFAVRDAAKRLLRD
jgi:hypothetical protein